ncbi:unnamed protein product, partial [Ectocarpus sp. 12 AP-2014]
RNVVRSRSQPPGPRDEAFLGQEQSPRYSFSLSLLLIEIDVHGHPQLLVIGPMPAELGALAELKELWLHITNLK